MAKRKRDRPESQIKREVPVDFRGTGSAALGEVKRRSEEAHLGTCPDCGYAGGRHARSCKIA